MLPKLIRYSGRTLLGILLFISAYFWAAGITAFIKTNTDYVDQPDGIEIAIYSNGVHTDIIVPVNQGNQHWGEFLSPAVTKKADSSFAYLAFGWGDKGFFIGTPTWADLKASTAVKAMFWMSTSAMHVTWRKNLPLNNPRSRRYKISPEAYRSLCEYMRASFDLNNQQPIYIPAPTYGNHDAFYEAKGSYSLFTTCNVWTGDGLRKAGIKTAIWTPFDKSLLGQ
jgi:uncharacterized protein (TIGR02117 family)